jgi:hypothetical protein
LKILNLNINIYINKIFLYFGYAVPYASITLLNCGIIYEATRFARAHRNTSNNMIEQSAEITASARRKAEMTKTILFITFLYIILTLPSVIMSGYYYNDLILLEIGQMIVTLLNNIQFSFPALNFVILYFSNKLFAKEVKILFSRARISAEQSQIGNNTPNTTLGNRIRSQISRQITVNRN